ncbi:MAG TPA: ABC transporter ATP-binding protein [Verrucomicrobiae bacterium]|jgi:ABC-2 type transport system ATP-binding protein|nr:ABC transporter ATP-binding protein [Verrucomicrobiae bacterium]
METIIQLDRLSKEYEPTSSKDFRVIAADRLDLQVSAGEIFGLVGPNGAGKTTTLKMICGLSVPTAGRVLVHGVDVERAPEEAQKYMGYLADFFSLYDELKVWEYLDYFAHAYKLDPSEIPGRVAEVIGWVGLEGKREAAIGGLSRGMKQRLGIARAIIHDPPLIVLDEPAAGLDPKARVELKDLLRELHRNGKTIFITSHILADLQEICTSIAIMEKGRLLRVGRLEDVMGEGKSTRRFRVRIAEAGFDLDGWLASFPGVSSVVKAGLAAHFDFAGEDSALAGLVRGLVDAGAPICGAEEITETLEQLYSRLSSGETM